MIIAVVVLAFMVYDAVFHDGALVVNHIKSLLREDE